MNSKTFQKISAGIMFLASAVAVTVGAINGTRETNHRVNNPEPASDEQGK